MLHSNAHKATVVYLLFATLKPFAKRGSHVMLLSNGKSIKQNTIKCCNCAKFFAPIAELYDFVVPR